jgi:hypothetical protein
MWRRTIEKFTPRCTNRTTSNWKQRPEEIGERAHVVLANGSVKKKGADPNSEAREQLREKIDLHGAAELVTRLKRPTACSSGAVMRPAAGSPRRPTCCGSCCEQMVSLHPPISSCRQR